MQHCDNIMKGEYSGKLSWEFAQDIQDRVKVYSDDKKNVIFDKTPAQVSIVCSYACCLLIIMRSYACWI